jgi:hypothetical protein
MSDNKASEQQCSICERPYMNGKQTCNCNAGPLQPLSSNPVTETLVRHVCTAYESGFGHGVEGRDLGNPYVPVSSAWEGYRYGYEQGLKKRSAHETAGVQVAGDTLTTTLWQFEQRASVLLSDEQSKANPDNALIGFICDAVRLARENAKMATGLGAVIETERRAVEPGATLGIKVIVDPSMPSDEIEMRGANGQRVRVTNLATPEKASEKRS